MLFTAWSSERVLDDILLPARALGGGTFLYVCKLLDVDEDGEPDIPSPKIKAKNYLSNFEATAQKMCTIMPVMYQRLISLGCIYNQ